MTNMKRTIATLSLAAWTLPAMNGLPAHAVTKEVSGCIQVRTASQLQAMKNNPAGTYCLMKDIDAGVIANFVPVGDLATPFTGRFYGNGHVIRNLKITNATLVHVGLFGAVIGGVIQDVGIVNANVSSSVGSYTGAVAGAVGPASSNAKLRRVYSTGQVTCAASVINCINGGVVGLVSGAEISDAWSSATVTGGYAPGGLIGGSIGNVIVRDSHATGDVTCTGTECSGVGGFAAQISDLDLVSESFATGKVTSPEGSLGGFVGFLGGLTSNVYATGAVTGGMNTKVGGLIGQSTGGGAQACFAAGPVQGGSGASVGGLIGSTSGSPVANDCFWDSDTTGQMSSAGGIGTVQTTAQLRANLPVGFTNGAWGINKTKSYPFLNSDGFSSNLATLVRADKIYTALPLMQSDESQYIGDPKHTNNAALATVYTMAARAIGQTLGVASLDNVKINKYFWNDTTQQTAFKGPVKLHATLGATHTIAPNTPIGLANVIGKLNQQNWVVLRGTYKKPGGGTATHYMLATLYTKKGAGNVVDLVIANDPFTGEQVAISPTSKTVVLPENFPLTGFKVNGYAVISNIH